MVSVIIPSYNHASFLKQRIESVLKQSYEDLEVIILDDASSDQSRFIIEQFRDHPKVSQVIYNELNSGSTFKQWEKGISIAKGQFIWIAESDDYCDINFVKSAVNDLNYYNSDLHYCQSHLVDENCKILEFTLKWPETVTSINWMLPFVMTGDEFVKKAFRFKNVIPNASAVIFRNGYFDFNQLNNFTSAGDWLFWAKMLINAKISFSPAILNSFRSHTNTTRGVTDRKKILLRYFEELAVRYRIGVWYKLDDTAELTRFLNATIDVCKFSDLLFFASTCRIFDLPLLFTIKFVGRKLLMKDRQSFKIYNLL